MRRGQPAAGTAGGGGRGGCRLETGAAASPPGDGADADEPAEDDELSAQGGGSRELVAGPAHLDD